MWKYGLTIFAIIVLTYTSPQSQTIHVVNNNPNAPTGNNIYNTLQSAIDEALSGDIIHVIPSKTPYEGVQINKELKIYGSGFIPSFNFETPPHALSWIKFVVFTRDPVASGSETKLSGLVIERVGFQPEEAFSNIRIEKCTIGSLLNHGLDTEFGVNYQYAQVSDLTITNCIIESGLGFGRDRFSGGSLKNTVITNNIFTHNNNGISIYFASDETSELWTPSLGSNILVANNLFFSSLNESDRGFALGLERDYSHNLDIKFANNILYGKPCEGSESMEFASNMVFGIQDQNQTFPPAQSADNGGNLTDTNPRFEDFPASGATSLEPSFDLQLRADSPGKNAGTDGTDIGIFGGAEPFDLTGKPSLPQIDLLDVSPVVQQGEDLQVNIQAQSN